jgi:ABC-type transport system substrate-binding protein
MASRGMNGVPFTCDLKERIGSAGGAARGVARIAQGDLQRLQRKPGLAGEINPITRVILLQCRNDRGFADDNVRLAAHHAINKEALSRAFYGGSAVPLPVVATPGTPA